MDRFEAFFDAANDAIFVHPLGSADAPPPFVAVNDAACERYGYGREELLRLTVADIAVADDRARAYWQSLQTTGRLVAEAQHVTRGGNVFPVEVSARVVAVGGERFVCALVRDITDRKAATARMQTVLGQLEALIANLQMGVLVETADRRAIHSNQVFCDMFGIPSPEVMRGLDCDQAARDASRLFADPAAFLAGVQHRLATREVAVNEEMLLRDGRCLERDYVPVMAGGEFLGNMWIYRDVTERKQAERQIREDEQRLKSLIDSTPDIICFKDGDGRWLTANQADLELFCLEGVDYRGKTDRELADFTAPIYREAFLTCEQSDELAWQAGGVSRGEEIIPHPDGTDRVYDVIKVPIFEPDGRRKGLVVLGRDVTDRSRMERQLVRQERLAAVGQLAAGIAHDFNNILTSVMGFTELVQQSPELPDSLRPTLETVSASHRKAAHLVRQILDFGQKTIRRPEPLELGRFVPEVVRFLAATIPESICIDMDFGDEEYWVEADPTQLHQAITNLAVNARDAMPDGGRLAFRLAHVHADGGRRCFVTGQPITGDMVRLEVADSGGGIAAVDLPRIFEPFYTTKEVGQGSGLGLSQVAGIIAQHGGAVDVTSEAGVGTSVVVCLPRAAPAERAEPAAARPVARPAAARPGAGRTVLLVEDEPTVLRAAAAMLEHLGYAVLAAASAQEALDLHAAHQGGIAIVLSDLVMPDLDGLALLRRLREREPDLKMILMSGYPLGDHERDLLADGVVAWVQKPLALAELEQLLAGALTP